VFGWLGFGGGGWWLGVGGADFVFEWRIRDVLCERFV
jgi:hypothetical protein